MGWFSHGDCFRARFEYNFGNLPQNLSLRTLVHGAWCYVLAQSSTQLSDDIAFGGTHGYSYHSSNKALFNLSPNTVRTGIIENATRTSGISLFGLMGGKHSEKIHLQPSAGTKNLTRRGDSNILAGFSIITVLTV